MSSIDNSGGIGGGFRLSVSGTRGSVQLNDGNENLGSYPTIKTTAGTLSASLFIGDGGLLSNTAGVSNLQQVTSQGAETTDAITTGGLTTTGTISATSLIVDTLTESLTVVGDVDVGGNATITGTLSSTIIQTPTIEISADASITGNLTVSGGVVTITSTTTDTYALNVQNSGTGPAIVANQTGNQPLVDFQDDSTSVFFISGGEGARPAGYVGIGTTEPAKKLEVIGDIKGTNLTATGTLTSAGITSSENIAIVGANKTLTSSNVNTSNLVVSGPVDITGTLSTAGLTSSENIEIVGANKTLTSSNVNTSNLVVSGPVDITGTLSTAGLTSSENIEIVGANKTLTSSNINTSNLVVSGPVDITGTLSAAGITSSAAVNVTGTISSSSTVTGTDLVVSGTAQGLNLTSTGTLSTAGLQSSADASITGNGSSKIAFIPQVSANSEDALQIYGSSGQLNSNLQYNGDALFRTITVSSIQGGSPLTIGAGADTINIQSNMIMVDGSILTATTIQCATLTTESGVNSNIEASNVIASNLVQGSIVSATSSLTGVSLTVSGDVQGASASLGVIDGTSVVVSGTAQGLNLTSTGTLSTAGLTSSSTITASANVKITGGYVQIKYA